MVGGASLSCILTDFLFVLSVPGRGFLKSGATIVHLFLFCFMYFEASLIVVYTFRFVIASSWIYPFIFMKCSFIFIAIIIVLKSTFSGINISTSAFFWFYHFHHVTFTNGFSFRHHVVDSCVFVSIFMYIMVFIYNFMA